MTTSAAPEDDGRRRVTFTMSHELAEQVDRMKALTDLTKDAEIFHKSFAIFRLTIDAIHEGKTVEIHDPEHPEDRRVIITPFKVKRKR